MGACGIDAQPGGVVIASPVDDSCTLRDKVRGKGQREAERDRESEREEHTRA